MISLNYSGTKYDKDVVWVFKWTIDGTTNYLSDRSISLTNSYDGEVFGKDGARSISKEIDISDGGGVGNVGSFDFNFVDKVSNANFNSFFNEFYPTTSKYLTNTKIEVGITWSGGSADTDINWLHTFYVENMDWVDSEYNLFCVEFDEFESKELPPYEIQTSYDNGISYFPNVPKENRNTPLPIIYGSFTLSGIIQFDDVFVPITLTDELEGQYAIACHKLQTLSIGSIYTRIDSLDNYVNLTGSGESVGNNYNATAKLTDTAGVLDGQIYLHPTTNTGDLIFSTPNEGTGLKNFTMTSVNKNVMDRDTSTSFTLTPGQKMGVMFNFTDVEPGILSQTLQGSFGGKSEMKIGISAKGSAGNCTYEVYVVRLIEGSRHQALPLEGSDQEDSTYYYPYTATTTQGYNSPQNIIFLDTKIEDLLNSAIIIHNTDGTDSLLVYEVYLELDGFRVSGITKRDEKKTIKYTREVNQGELDYVAGRWRERGF